MTNEQIIANVAIENNIYTEDEIKSMIESGKEIPIHTLQGWNIRGQRIGKKIKVKKGEHGIETKLWKKKNAKDNTNVASNEADSKESISKDFYLTKAYLFHIDQVEITE